MMQQFEITDFRGLVTAEASPSVRTAKAVKNLLRHKKRGELWEALGYAKKFSALPANEPTIRKISAIAFENIHSFWVPEHGGRNVTVLTGTYAKAGWTVTPSSRSQMAIWIRPWWDGAAWQDSWRELTEFFAFEVVAVGTGGNNDKVYIDDGVTFEFATADPGGQVFNATYFKNWTMVVNNDLTDHDDNFDLVKACGFITVGPITYYYLQQVNVSNHNVGDILYLYRNFVYREMPSTLTSQIFSLLKEIRLTSGNGSADMSLMAGLREKTFASSAGGAYSPAFAEIIADVGALDVWPQAAIMGIVGSTPDAAGLPAGTFRFKTSIVMDDDQETIPTDAYDETVAPVGSPQIATLAASTGIVLGAAARIRIRPYRSYGALPRRASKMNIYAEKDGDGYFYFVKQIDLTAAATWDGGACYTTVVANDHYYEVGGLSTAIELTGTDWTNAGPEASANLGRAITDTGIVRARFSGVVGRLTYAAAPYVGSTLLANRLMACASNGNGSVTPDIFPSDGAHIIDLEYNDGDEIVAFSPVGITDDRVLVKKRRSAVVITPITNGFSRNVVTAGDGCCSARSVARFDDMTYWAGYNGVYRFVQRSGWEPVNPMWIEDWKALSDAVKEASVGVIDAKERQYLLTAGGKTYKLDLDDGETMVDVPTNVPVAYATQTRTGKVDFLSGSLIQTLGDGELHDGTAYALEWESNRQTTLTPDTRESRDLRVVGLGIRYESDVALTLTLYLGDSSVAACTPWTLSAGNVTRTVYVPLDAFARCKYFRWKIGATKSTAGQKVRVRGVTPLVEVLPAGGDQRSL